MFEGNFFQSLVNSIIHAGREGSWNEKLRRRGGGGAKESLLLRNVDRSGKISSEGKREDCTRNEEDFEMEVKMS